MSLPLVTSTCKIKRHDINGGFLQLLLLYIIHKAFYYRCKQYDRVYYLFTVLHRDIKLPNSPVFEHGVGNFTAYQTVTYNAICFSSIQVICLYGSMVCDSY